MVYELAIIGGGPAGVAAGALVHEGPVNIETTISGFFPPGRMAWGTVCGTKLKVPAWRC